VRRGPEKLDPKEEAISRLIRAVRRQHEAFVRLLNHRDRLFRIGASLDDTQAILARLDRDMTASEQQLKGLGYTPKHQEKQDAA
jgi:hypothetical protein